MRLLHREANGTLSLTDELEHSIPPYAILSHRWGEPDQEVSYDDIVNGRGQNKSGYRKVTFCERQASDDGLQYFWIDTCCIDKTNSAQLSEAITSMFRWYQNASKCYVYLSDVSAPNHILPNSYQVWESSFRGSQWFKRGWTLQELLAPHVVEFFSEDGTGLGDKRSLERLIHESTSISVWALRGTPLTSFGVEERLLWASKRQTTRKEDEAYCLQGIFGVFIGVQYGEREYAFVRLRKAIEDFPPVQPRKSSDTTTHPQKRRKVMDTEPSLEKDHLVLQSLAFSEMNHRFLDVETRHQNTCEWILDTLEYKQWRSFPRGLLWIKGKPGAGKSTVMAFLYDQLEKQAEQKSQHPPEVKLQFFLSARGVELQRTFHGLLRALLHQLFLQDATTRQKLRTVFTEQIQSFGSAPNSWQWHSSELRPLLTTAVFAASQLQPVTVFVDALDEAGEDAARMMAEYFHQLNDQANAAQLQLKICISCRHYPIVSREVTSLEVTVENHNNLDIAAFIKDKLHLCPPADHSSSDHKALHTLRSELTQRAQGVFQWAHLIVPLAQKYIDRGESPQEVRYKLQKVPDKLKDVYVHIFQNVIDEADRALSFRLLQWVCLAVQPLTVTEMRYALGTEGQALITTDNRMKLRIKSLSGGLVEVTGDQSGGQNRIQAVHQSVIDFLLKDGLVLLAKNAAPQTSNDSLTSDDVISKCHATLYWACLTLLASERVRCLHDLSRQRFREAKHWYEICRDLPLVNYAIFNLFIHAEKAGVHRSSNLKDEIITLEKTHPVWKLQFYRFQHPYREKPSLHTQLLHVASAANMVDVVSSLVHANCEIDVRNESGQTPLHLAAHHGHQGMAVILTDAGAEMNAVDSAGRTPLIHAAGRGHDVMVQWFIHHGASLNHSTGPAGSALNVAAQSGFIALVNVLINAGAEVNPHGSRDCTPLQAASLGDSEAVVRMLLDRGAKVNAQGGSFGNALQAASYAGREALVKILLDRGADVNARGGEYGNALQAASLEGNVAVVQMLLDGGAEVNAQGGEFGTALQAASFAEHEALVQTLLDRGAHVNVPGGTFGNALQAASLEGNVAVVQILLDGDADVNAQGGRYGNVLQAASYAGSEALVKILLDKGANVNAQGGSYGNALQAASLVGNVAVVQMLLDSGADVNAQGGRYGNALQAASLAGNVAVVQMLLDSGADVNAQGGEFGNALQAASCVGHEALVQKLLDRGTGVNAQGERYGNALQVASLEGNVAVVKMLLDRGADVNAQGGRYGNALQAASWQRNEEVVQMLLSHGAKPDPV